MIFLVPYLSKMTKKLMIVDIMSGIKSTAFFITREVFLHCIYEYALIRAHL